MKLSSLNPEQRAAVEQIDGPVLILAGAGSGKTRVITFRIAYLLQQGVAAENILAVTFTNKAAKEMRERVAELVENRLVKEMTISTFHSLGVKILKKEIARLGFKKNFTIYGAADQARLIRDIVGRLAPQGEKYDAERILYLISAAKNRLELPANFRFNQGDPYAIMAAEVYPEYQKALKAFNAVDFDDILLYSEKLLHDFEEVRTFFRQQFRYIMVDEYQDTNEAQYKILHHLTGAERNLCVVGDDDQSIYAWRGANPGNILDFEIDFPGAKVVKLESNYRSTGNILAAANGLIAHNSKRKDKVLRAMTGDGEPLVHVSCFDEEAEAQHVITHIRNALYNKEASYNDFAVLYRTNLQSRVFEEQLRYEDIPYVLIGGQQFFDRKEVKDVLAYLRVILNSQDEVNLLRILNYPRRGIGTTSADRLIRASAERNCSLWDVLVDPAGVEGLDDRVRDAISRFVGLLQSYQQRFRTSSGLAALLRQLVTDIDIEGELHRSLNDPDRARKRMTFVEDVVSAMATYEERDLKPSLHGFLDKVSLLDAEDPNKDDKEKKLQQNAVVLMSLHSSKGLEFDHVFLVGVEEEYLPHTKSISEVMDIDEERRLCYVGITRARKTLIMSSCEQRRKFGKMLERIPSRFLEEIPESVLVSRASGEGAELAPEEEEQKASAFFSNIQGLFDD
jgi:DNA helicase-2/ATP-dependent DNA helicase PcrA